METKIGIAYLHSIKYHLITSLYKSLYSNNEQKTIYEIFF